MTEAEWLVACDPQAMLDHLASSGRSSPRKYVLFAIAVCRRVIHLMPDPRSRVPLEVSETREEFDSLSDSERAAAEAAVFDSDSAAGRIAARMVSDLLVAAPFPGPLISRMAFKGS